MTTTMMMMMMVVVVVMVVVITMMTALITVMVVVLIHFLYCHSLHMYKIKNHSYIKLHAMFDKSEMKILEICGLQ
jgi:hypothetical protein